mgnify:CR=1 FL=1
MSELASKKYPPTHTCRKERNVLCVAAAAALFLRDTSQFPQFLLRMARFRGINKNEFFDNQRTYGNFFTLLDAGMAFFFIMQSYYLTNKGREALNNL